MTADTQRLRPGLVDFNGGHAWLCSKTEWAAGASDAWGVEPNYAVVDHSVAEGIQAMWTVLPGKMTLALHASQDLAVRLTCSEHELVLPPPLEPPPPVTAGMVAESPWSMSEALAMDMGHT